jgi:hypothetical protein
MIYCQHNKDTNKISFEHIYIYIFDGCHTNRELSFNNNKNV